MLDVKKLISYCRLPAKILFAGSVFILPVQTAWAAANINLSTGFSAADGVRTYMDIGGTWNGTTEVNTGDGFTLSVSNTGPDPAFDIRDIPVTVPAGFVLASNAVTVSDVACSNNINANASQGGGAGTPVIINIISNNSTVIDPGCAYNFTFRLETNTTAPAGTQSIGYTVTYNTINNDNGSVANTLGTQNIDVNAGALSITKSTPVTSAITGQVISYNITVSSTGSGGLFDVQLNDVLSSDLNNLTFNVPDPPPGANGPGADDYTFEYLEAGETVNLTVDATVTPLPASDCPVLENSASLSERTGVSIASVGPVAVQFDFQFTSGPFSNVISHDATSYCEFCGEGVVSITVQNPTGAPLTSITLREDLLASGLEYSGSGTVNGAASAPGIVGNVLTWNLPNLAALGSHVITFGVRSSNAENLITAVRDITATVDFDMSCLAATQSVNTGLYEVPIRQPVPTILKDGRNFDAGQGGYSDPIFGNENDDVIWRVNVQNAGQANMEALLMNDSINGNFTIGSICPDEASAVATATAGGTPAAGCRPMAGNNPFDVNDPFGNAADPDDIGASSVDAFIYYVGRILAAHTNNTNTNDISWGCFDDSPTGGLITVPASNGGATPGVTIIETGDLNTTVVAGGLQITQAVTGSNTGQPLGSKGLVTVVINNQTGGTIDNVQLQNIVPNGYVLDETFGSQTAPTDCDCTFIFDPAYGPPGSTYPGFIDTVVRDDAERNNGNPVDDLNPNFTFTSSTAGADGNQVNLLRNGDILTLTFGIVMIDPTRFDLVADLDVAPETAPATDPANALALTSTATVSFDSSDGAGVQNQAESDVFNFNSAPEDLDVSISDALFILTNNPGTPLPLNVDLTNSGGHDADDYSLYVSLGQAMVVQTISPPGGCVLTTNAPPHPTWNTPAAIPGPLSTPLPLPAAAVYLCNRGTIAPGQTETFTFNVIKQLTGTPQDDLTFRADVIGEVTLFNGDRLLYSGTPASPNLTPPSLPDTSPNQQRANNYTLDAVRSRVLGFNLVKSAWYCAEDNQAEPGPPAEMLPGLVGVPVIPTLIGNLNSQIGEDCNYRIESGGWFGFVTPGFTLIEVQNVAVTDDLPDGQGFIPFNGNPNPFNFTNTTGITLTGTNGGAGTTPLDETDIVWQFNAAGTGIGVKDEYFRVDFKTRLLNDPFDLAYPVPGGYAPNLHDNTSTNIARTSFDAIFNSATGNVTINVNDGAGIPGYPAEGGRMVDLTEVEPNLIITKQVCNEDLSPTGPGPGCTPFLDTVNNGDTNDSYIYRVTMLNEASFAGTARTPAFNVISTDTLDASGLMIVNDFTTDLLDNDGDGVADPADTDEGTITGNTIGVPAVITIDESHNPNLAQVDPGTPITFYYRVDPDISIAPLQTLTNVVSMSYDSLLNDFGNQNDPQIPNADPRTSGRARIYTTIDDSPSDISNVANVIMIPVIALPKLTVATANTPASSPQNVSIGEEVRYLLVADLPVANLRQFKIRDELPAGVSCVELQDVNLSNPPYAAAGFSPGGPPVSTTCSGQVAEWNFGDQAVTLGTPGARFNFPITLVARVDNIGANTEPVTLTNGGVAIDDPIACTSVGGGGVGVCYINDALAGVSLDFAPVDIVVREPVIALTKSFLPVVNSDAADILTVTVTATNNGNAAAYNLQVLDNLVGSDMTYIVGKEGGPNQPDSVDTSVANRPVFSWTPPPVPPSGVPPQGPDYEILPGATKTFTFQVQVDTTAQPLEILDNTIEAKWDSLPYRFTTLNTLTTPATIGPDGSATGLRNGVVPNLGVAPNIYETFDDASTSVLPLTMTKTDLDFGVVVPAIGAHRNFQVVIDLPEGTTNNLIIDDELVAGGVSYVLRRDGGLFDITYTFQDIISINGQLSPTEADFRGATAGPPTLPLPIDGDSGTITWDIGDVITAEEDDLDAVPNTVNPRIIINYFARPNNDLATNDGVNLQNAASTTYDNGETGATETLNDDTAAQTVVEPLLTIGKTVINTTGPGDPVAGDVLEYRITISHDLASNATAFDSNIVDTLDDHLLFDASFAPTAILDASGSNVTGFVPAPTITPAPASTLTWGRINADNTLDIPVGSTIVLTYHAIVQNSIEPNVIISNSVIVDWTSLDDTDLSSAFERTGLDCLAATVGVNDYCSAPAVANITALNSNDIVKTVINDTYANPLDGVVRIGDIITYQLDVNIQQGTTASVNILDAIEPGMAFVDVISINGATASPYTSPVGSNFSYAPIPAINVPAADDRLSFDWALGDIVNDADGDDTNDTLVIIYRARVVDNEPGVTIIQQPTTPIRNTANLTYMDGNGSPVLGLDDFADIDVRQPVMGALSKTDRSGRSSGDPVNVATDTMNFRLETCNTINPAAPAYGLKITDTLPTELDNTSLTVPVVTIGGNAATDGVDYVYTPPAAGPAGRGGNLVFTFNTPIDPAECVNIDFDIGFYSDFGFGAFSNLVEVNEYYSLPPADAQLYGPLGPEPYIMSNPLTVIPPPAKIKFSPADEATIGDEVVYHITVPGVATGTILYDVTITDILHPGLVYVSATDVGSSGFTITDTVLPGNEVNLVIDQIPAGQQAIIELRARVENNAFAQEAVSVENSASYTYANSPAGLPNNAGSSGLTGTPISIIEPLISVVKSVANDTKPGLAPDAGDVLRYTITLTASGGGVAPADFFSDAFDVSITDSLSLGLLYIDGSETVTPGSTIDLPVKVGDGIAEPQSLSWSLVEANADIDVTEGTIVTVTYDVLVLDSVLADQNLSNTVDIQWSSRDGPNVNERDGSGLPLNDYFNLVSAATLETTPDNNTIVKSRLSDTYDPVAPNDNIVRIGDIIEYQLVINMQEGTSPDFVIEDTLDEGLIFEGTVSINGQDVAPYPAVSPFSHEAIPAAIVSGDPATGPTTVTWTPGGDVLNPGDVINAGVGDNDITNNDFVIVYRARVLNLALDQIPTNTPLNNNVDFDYTMASGAAPPKTSSQQLELHQPDLSVTKTSLPVDGSVINAGDVVTYTVEITNNGDSPAYDTELLDTIPLGLRSPAITMVSMSLASGTPLPAVPLAPVYDPVTGTANWNFDTGTADEYSIPALDTLQIVYQVQADAGLGAGMTLTNSAQVQFYYSFDNDAPPSLAGINGVREIYGPSNLAQVTLTTTPANALLKINPADLDASIGETFTYRITVPENTAGNGII